jgi:para-nitrobenzyl esterase
LGGESAGAMSVLVHMVSPASQGLFDKAVIESGTIALPYNQPNGTNSYFKKLLSKAGCPEESSGNDDDQRNNGTLIDCLRALPTEAFLDAQDDMMANLLGGDALKQPADLLQPFYPAIYTEDVPMHPLDAFEQGRFNKVPTIIGNNHDEGVLFVNFIFGGNQMLPMSVPLETMYPAILAAFFGFTESQAIKDEYSNQTSALDALAAMVTDYMFSASTRKVASSLDKEGVPVSTYVFSYTPQTLIPDLAGNLGPVMDLIKYCEDKACHGEEIPFVFNAFEIIGAYDERDMAIVKTVGELWNSFIKSEEDENRWPRYTSDKRQWLNIGNNLTVIDRFNEQKLDFWNKTFGFDYWPQRV